MANNFSSEIQILQNLPNVLEEGADGDSPNESENQDITSFEKYIINHKIHLEERLKKLQTTMTYLKQQLAEEKSMWKAQLTEILQDSAAYEHELQENAELENAYEPKINFTEVAEDTDLLFVNTVFTDYDFKISSYKDPLFKLQIEKRASLKRQISISNYKRRLLEVENMCNMELLRVKQNVQFLQPLQMIASEWNLDKPKDINNGVLDSQPSELSLKDNSDSPKVDNTSSKSQTCNDVSSAFTKIQCSGTVPQNKFLSTSNVWRLDEELLEMKRANLKASKSSEYLSANVPTNINLF